MDDSEFSEEVSKYLQLHGLSWVESAVRATLNEGVPTRKDVASFGMSAEVVLVEDKSQFFSRSEDYTSAFERRGNRKSVEGTRPFSQSETAQLYVDALYSVLIEPEELAKAALVLLGEGITTVVVSSEDGAERFDVREVVSDRGAEMPRLQELLESAVTRAS